MSNTPYMNLNLPVPTVDVGPEWAEELNTAIESIDEHDHTSGSGKPVPASGLDINTDLTFKGNKATDVKAVELENQGTLPSGAGNASNIVSYLGDLYYVNSSGQPVQLTSGNSIVSSVIVPASPLMPSGTILDFAGPTAPPGFVLCNGQALSRATESNLFAAIGTTWGVGDGTTTFNVPNLNGRTTIGSGSYTDSVSGSVTRTLGQSLGAEKHVLTESEMPSHTHIQNAHDHGFGKVAFGQSQDLSNTQPVTVPRLNVVGSPESTSVTATNQNTGGGISHNNMQPSAVVLKMIKL